MTLNLKPFDPAEYIRTPEEEALYLNDAMESGDAAVVAAALGTIARAHGSSQMAKAAGISRASLYKGMSADGNPTLSTVMAVMKELGLTLSAHPKAA